MGRNWTTVCPLSPDIVPLIFTLPPQQGVSQAWPNYTLWRRHVLATRTITLVTVSVNFHLLTWFSYVQVLKSYYPALLALRLVIWTLFSPWDGITCVTCTNNLVVLWMLIGSFFAVCAIFFMGGVGFSESGQKAFTSSNVKREPIKRLDRDIFTACTSKCYNLKSMCNTGFVLFLSIPPTLSFVTFEL